MKSATYRELIRGNPIFRRLWLSQIISEGGNWLSFVAELGVLRSLSGSPLSVTTLLLAKLLPFFIAAPFAGVLTDSRSRKHIMLAADAARALAALGYLAADRPGRGWVVYACAAVISASTVFFEAARNAALPGVVAAREMLTANVMMSSTRFILASVGAGLAGVVATQFGYHTAFIINSASFVVSAALITPMSAAPPPGGARSRIATADGSTPVLSGLLTDRSLIPLERASPAGVHRPPAAARSRNVWSAVRAFINELRDGWGYIRRTPFVRALILVNVMWATGGGLVSILFDRLGGVVFRESGGDMGVSALFGAASMGLFFGTLCAQRAVAWDGNRRRAGRLLGWALFAHGICLAAGGLIPSLAWVLLLVAVSRFLMGIEIGIHDTMMMRVLTDRYRGRVYSADRALEILVMSLSAVAGGWALSVISPMSLLIISGLLSTTPGLAWLLALKFTRFRVPTRAVVPMTSRA
jgi:MFS family permease